MKKVLALVLLFVCLASSRAQVAGLSTLTILDVPVSTFSAGLGFDYLSRQPHDITLAMGNPSLIDPGMHGGLSVGYVNLFSGSNFGTVAYCHDFRKVGTFTFGLQFGSYGKFQGYDEMEQFTGDFTAADYVMTIGWGKAVDDHVSIGANFKPIISHYEDYTALAVAFDLAATYHTLDNSFYATFMGRNIGAQLLTFDGTAESLPFELSLVSSYKLSDAPFRIHLALTELQTWDLTYDDPLNPTTTTDPFTGTVTQPSGFKTFADKAFRHFNVGVELAPNAPFYATLGYSYRQMAEMRGAEAFNLSGFSFGIGIIVKGFHISYARNNYHLSQAPNFISVTTNLERFFK